MSKIAQIQIIKGWLLIALSLSSLSCNAATKTMTGLVIKIADGDTLTILTKNHKQIKIRLTEIDAPEKSQPFGNQSKQSLAKLCFNKMAIVTTQKRDRYNRVLGRVSCNGIDANSEQVKLGMAWVYNKYVTDKSLYGLQKYAQSKKIGLWSDSKPIPPWIKRHR
ncbi:thermonuclease family protein [Legionella erythra]|uniref:Putative endonuclease n=2 Tax=Legionella erythra TaxID=448 RepID=A0A0W0TST9_LEGER|nr:thermonuclease family protein [Legionella erythra]KTC98681.1 putative endonuclease precursor [Legionella erythra]